MGYFIIGWFTLSLGLLLYALWIEHQTSITFTCGEEDTRHRDW
jgi:hypothetical protein